MSVQENRLKSQWITPDDTKTQVRGDLKKSEEDLKCSRGEGEEKGEQVRKLEVRLKELEGDKKESGDLLTRTRVRVYSGLFSWTGT